MKDETFYQIERTLASLFFKPLYHPKIIGKEKIPKEGPLIFCGNHLHVWDQVPVICATKEWIHWFAKKEYFDSKMGWFYEKSGCICVDRDGNAHKAFDKGIEILKHGESIGIFPEGTRNQYQVGKLKLIALEKNKKQMDEYALKGKLKGQELENLKKDMENAKRQILKEMEEFKKNYETRFTGFKVPEEELLPFHYGAVSMAKETKATLVPFAVTGDYKIHSKNLLLRFGDPMIVILPKEEANKQLRNKVLSLVRENLKETNLYVK